MTSITKKCTKCGLDKDLSDFQIIARTVKLRSHCKMCRKKYFDNLYQVQAEDRRAWAREYSKTYYPTVKDRKRRYAVLHKEEIKVRMAEYQKEYYLKNKERIDKKNKTWSLENPEKRTALSVKRRVMFYGAEGFFTPNEWKDLCHKYKNKCLCCRKKKKLTVDHIVPLIAGGTNWINNIQCLCKSCNSRKGTKTIDYRPKEL